MYNPDIFVFFSAEPNPQDDDGLTAADVCLFGLVSF
jgi:hypothetical protein